jgi:NTP pyrophosphatase (non-canonical NTP hydrolase)
MVFTGPAGQPAGPLLWSQAMLQFWKNIVDKRDARIRDLEKKFSDMELSWMLERSSNDGLRAQLAGAKMYVRELESKLNGTYHPPTLKDFIDAIHKWSDHNWPGRAPKDVLCCVVEELGELMRAQSKGDQGIRGTPEHWEAEARKEYGDVLIGLLDYARNRGWDTVHVLKERWGQVRVRDWKRFPGNGVSR